MIRAFIILVMMVLGGTIEGAETSQSKGTLSNIYNKAKNATVGRAKEVAQPAVDTIKAQPVVKKITNKIDCRRYCNSKSKCKNNPVLAQDCKENCGEKTRCYIGFQEEQKNIKSSALPQMPETPKEIPEEPKETPTQTTDSKAINSDVLLEKILALPCKDRYQIISAMTSQEVKEEDKPSNEEKDFLLGQCPSNPWQSSSPSHKNSENTMRRIMNQDQHIMQRQGTPSIKPTTPKPTPAKEIAPFEFSETPIARSLTDLEPGKSLSSAHEEIDLALPDRLLEAQKALDYDDSLSDKKPNAQRQLEREKQLKEYFEIFEKEYFPTIRHLSPITWKNKNFWTNFLKKFNVHAQFPEVTEEDMINEFQRLVNTHN